MEFATKTIQPVVLYELGKNTALQNGDKYQTDLCDIWYIRVNTPVIITSCYLVRNGSVAVESALITAQLVFSTCGVWALRLFQRYSSCNHGVDPQKWESQTMIDEIEQSIAHHTSKWIKTIYCKVPISITAPHFEHMKELAQIVTQSNDMSVRR